MSDYQSHNPNQRRDREPRQQGRWEIGQDEDDRYDREHDAQDFRARGNYPDYEAVHMPRGYQGSDTQQWNNQQRDGNRGRVSFADQWPPSGYQTQQPRGASPSWQNNPSRSNDDYANGAYGLNRNRPADYSFGRDFGSSAGYGYSQGNQSHRGRGPKGYERSDERIREDICERLAQDPHVDASDITVSVEVGVVTLEGSVDERVQKHWAEDIADSCSGVKDVQNRLNVIGRNRRDFDPSQQRTGDNRQRSEFNESKTASGKKETQQ